MEIKLSDHFDYRRLIRFTLPSVVMMLFASIYGVVDGLFISNVEGETAFAAINLIMPYCMMFSVVGSLFGVGGSALVAYIQGKGEKEKANQIFSMLVYVMIGLGIILTGIGEYFLEPVVRLFGANDGMYNYAVTYGRVFLTTVSAFLLQFAFQTFMVTAEQPKLGLYFTVGAGISNMFLDWLFIAKLRLGVTGAAAASCIGQCVGGYGPLLFFIFSKKGTLHLGKPLFSIGYLLKACSNGLADCITNIALNFVSIIYNFQLMKYIGEIGVSAYGIIMYVNFVFVAVYIGYSMGTAPVFSYHYGAENTKELKNLFSHSVRLILGDSLVLSTAAIIFAQPIASIFAGYEKQFLETSTTALRIYSVSYFFAGLNIFTSGLFAALNNGKLSTVLSFFRTLVFQLTAVLLLPIFFGVNGIWAAMPCSEVLVFALSVLILYKANGFYRYI